MTVGHQIFASLIIPNVPKFLLTSSKFAFLFFILFYFFLFGFGFQVRAGGEAVFYGPQYWGQPEDVLTRRCDQCGEVGNLACFSPSFLRWVCSFRLIPLHYFYSTTTTLITLFELLLNYIFMVPLNKILKSIFEQ